MDQDLFTYLPSDIILIILSRLPARTIMSCKCVCKPWLNLLATPEFVKSHISNSVPGLAVFERETISKPLKIIEFVDEVDLNRHEHHWNIVFNLDLPFDEPLHSSANGLLFLCNRHGLYLCNPITREYINLPLPRHMSRLESYGFGVSRMSRQFKVVRISHDVTSQPPSTLKFDQVEWEVYTVGTGSWRRIASGCPLAYVDDYVGTFLNGNLHWLALNLGSSRRISCLDLETEFYSAFSSPPPPDNSRKRRKLSVLGDCLCVCDASSNELLPGYKIDIWLMKEYGDEKSWTKEFVIGKFDMDGFLGVLCPVKVFKDGDILMELTNSILLYYSSKTETTRVIDQSGFDRNIINRTTIYAPSFLSLKTFAMEKVISF